MKFSKIAKEICKDPRAVFTHYKRYLKKDEKKTEKNIHRLGGEINGA